VGRLADGVTVEQAHAEITGIATRLRDRYPDDNAGKLAAVVPLKEIVVGDTRPMLLVLMAAVGLLLVIACANVANLLLVRAAARAREMQVRAAVGAGRSRLMRQMLTESAVIGVAGAAAGVWLARLGVLALVALAPADLPRAADIAVDATALGFGLLAALGASLLFGLAPALQVSGFGPAGVLHGGGKGTSLGSRTGWARSTFVVVQVALALVLVIGAGLLARSLTRLGAVDVGLQPDRLLVLRTSVPVASLEEAPRATAFYRELLTDLRAVPGVVSAAAVTSLPTAVRSNGAYWLEGGPGPDTPGHRAPQAVFTVATPGYFATAGIPLLNGRDFSHHDRTGAELVAIVSESLARQAFAGEDPIGRRIKCGLDAPAFMNFMTIVGVVADVRTYGPAMPPQPELYMPYVQHPGPASALNVIVKPPIFRWWLGDSRQASACWHKSLCPRGGRGVQGRRRRRPQGAKPWMPCSPRGISDAVRCAGRGDDGRSRALRRRVTLIYGGYRGRPRQSTHDSASSGGRAV
jgi:putative ABC transport system permease protein